MVKMLFQFFKRNAESNKSRKASGSPRAALLGASHQESEEKAHVDDE